MTTYRLSSMQEGMLFNNQMSPNSGVDIEQIIGTLHEAVDVSAFKNAWDEVIAGHTALRTCFRLDDHGVAWQDVRAYVDLHLEEVDWRNLSSAEQESQLNAFLVADRRHGFDLSKAPLSRVALFRASEEEYQFVWTFHHIILDGRSQFIILRELFNIYDALRRDETPELAAAPTYESFIEWLQQHDTDTAESYWQRVLGGFRAPTPPVVDKQESLEAADGDKHSQQDIILSAEATTTLIALAEKHGLTLNTFVQGAWALLLSRYSNENDVVFGAVRACRHGTVPRAADTVGVFINTLPVRVQVNTDTDLIPWLKALRQQNIDVRPYEHTPLFKIQKWSDLLPGEQLFESIIVFNKYSLNETLRSADENWQHREVDLIEKTSYPLTLYGYAEAALRLRIGYDLNRFDDATIQRMLGHMKTLLESMATDPQQKVMALPLVTEAERRQLLYQWNETVVDYPRDQCIHHLFEEQAARTPDAIALIFENQELTYRELNERSNQLARVLQKLKVGPDVPVGIFMMRSPEMMVALLAVVKAGGAYLPLDPEYPRDRIAFMIEDAKIPVLLTQARLISDLPKHQAQVITVDGSWDLISFEDKANVTSAVTPDNLSYVIYTSGSTGKPKGVMVQHGNVVNFFAGMDERIPHEPPGTWLAVTSLSFDISVLELFWTLARGFKVILYSDKSIASVPAESVSTEAQRQIDFSLFYFASDESEQGITDKYTLLLEGARFADRNGFAAIWTPERHFHAFGGLYPNPSVASAAIAAITERLQIRAGSCVLPLHNPIRVAEEWSVVDNISQGRVGISFASGWQPNDFVLKPENHADRKEIMFRDIETVRQLWRGETVTFPGPNGDEVEVSTLPRPVQADLPVWITAAGNPETFHMAGANGFNILSHLLGQSVEELAAKVNIYREAWAENGHPGEGHVTLMLHTLIGEDVDEVRELARKPMTDYLRSAMGLVRKAAWHFPAFKDMSASTGKDPLAMLDSGDLPEEDMDALLNFSFERYFETSGLFGTPESALNIVNQLKAIGIDEIGCLIDFGVDSSTVMDNLKYLRIVKELAEPIVTPDYSIASQIRRYGVTHLQCTPSMASIFLLDKPSRDAISKLQVLMVGGEAFPPAMAGELSTLIEGEIINMYGPTETTIWSSTYPIITAENPVSIGRPIANTEIYILDKNFQPVPVGVAGDLYIGGDGVVRGYLNRPDLTAERFIEHPFGREPGKRIYHTGDLARYRADGNIEFLGRIDHQVKLRGYRIEMGEIETLLTQHPQVREAVVVAREDLPGDTRLVAYLIPEKRKQPSARDLHAYLRASLPEFMVPASYVTLEAFPQTPNRKIDRRALPAPDQARPEMESAFIAPRTPLEETLAAIWSEVLNVERIGVQDNFFELGGHSLSAVQVAFRVRQSFGVDLPLQRFLLVPTLAGLARELENELLAQTEEVELQQLVQEIEQLSDEEVELLLAMSTTD